MSKVPYRKKWRVKRAKRQFDRKMKRNKKLNKFYAEEVGKDGEILELHLDKKDEIKEKIVLDLLEHEKRKDELEQFASQKFEDKARERIQQATAMQIANDERERMEVEAAIRVANEEQERTERRRRLAREDPIEVGDDDS
ncbi:MAG: hypothetical protein ACTSO7_00520 [Candidatus Heimdallarchaeota archaeon]